MGASAGTEPAPAPWGPAAIGEPRCRSRAFLCVFASPTAALLRRLREGPGPQPDASRRLLPPAGRNLEQRREIDGVPARFTTLTEYNRWTAAAEPLWRPMLGQKGAVLRMSGGRRDRAAQLLNVHSTSLSRWLRVQRERQVG